MLAGTGHSPLHRVWPTSGARIVRASIRGAAGLDPDLAALAVVVAAATGVRSCQTINAPTRPAIPPMELVGPYPRNVLTACYARICITFLIVALRAAQTTTPIGHRDHGSRLIDAQACRPSGGGREDRD